MREKTLAVAVNLKDLGVKELVEIDGGNSVQAEPLFLKLRDMIADFFGGNKED